MTRHLGRVWIGLAIVTLIACEDDVTAPYWSGWVSTDRSEYHAGEDVQLTLTNSRGGSVLLADCGGVSVSVQERVDGNWQDTGGVVIGGEGGCIGPTPVVIQIGSDSSYAGTFNFDRSGTFRFGYRVQVEPHEDQIYETWYSAAARFESN